MRASVVLRGSCRSALAVTLCGFMVLTTFRLLNQLYFLNKCMCFWYIVCDYTTDICIWMVYLFKFPSLVRSVSSDADFKPNVFKRKHMGPKCAKSDKQVRIRKNDLSDSCPGGHPSWKKKIFWRFSSKLFILVFFPN